MKLKWLDEIVFALPDFKSCLASFTSTFFLQLCSNMNCKHRIMETSALFIFYEP